MSLAPRFSSMQHGLSRLGKIFLITNCGSAMMTHHLDNQKLLTWTDQLSVLNSTSMSHTKV